MRVLVLGNGLSGESARKFLTKKGYEVEILDEREMNKIALEKKTDRLFSGLSFIVTSPGISHKNYIIKEAKKQKIKVVGELELGADNLQGSVIAVTGTNGKTTTVTLINFLLKDLEKQTFLGGNIGIPVTSFAGKTAPDDITVLECSSYQLEDISHFHSHIACILNISPDHLARHKKMQNYIKAKQNIAKNQTKNDFLLLNADCELLMQNIPKTKAQIYFFSTKQKVVGCYVKRNSIYFNDGKTDKKLVSLAGVKLLGEHNLSNILCSVLAVYLQTGQKSILSGISKFEGIEHRIEFVMSVSGVLFYNDSKATNIDSTKVALSCFKRGIHLILGGSEKGYDFDELFAKLPKNVKNIAVFGQTKPKILSSAEKFGYKKIYSCESLRACTRLLYDLSKPKDVVLLSPACASFDHFKNYEERGRVFKKIVKEISLDEDALFEGKKKT